MDYRILKVESLDRGCLTFNLACVHEYSTILLVHPMGYF